MPKFDLSNTMRTINDEPIYEKVSYNTFNNPETIIIKSSGDEKEGVLGYLTKGKELTYRKAIQGVLLSDISADHPDYQKMPDKEDRMMLAMKLIADSEVELNAENEIPTILKTAKIVSSTLQYMRIYQLFEK